MTSRIVIQLTRLIGIATFTCSAGCSSESAAPKSGSSSEGREVSNTTGEQVNQGLLTVQIEPGHSVTFYEPEPGVVYPFERMKGGQHSRLAGHEGADLLQLFEALQPGEAVPEALIDAHARSLVATVDDPPDGDEPPAFGGGSPAPASIDSIGNTDPNTGVVRQASSSSDPAHFVNDHGGCTAGTTFGHCRINWWNGYWATANATFQGCVVDHFSGNGVVVRFQAGSTISDNYLAPGTQAYYWNYLPKVKTIRRIDVINAENDGFHVGCYWGSSY